MVRTTLSRLLLCCLLVAVSPAWADKILAVTPSGSPEAHFAGSAASVVSKLTSGCMDSKWTVVSSSANEVVCETQLSMGQSIMGQMLLGNSYSTPPRQFYRFSVAENAGITRVQPSGWMETQMAFGQVNRVAFTGAPFQNSVMTFMASLGGAYPVGTTFPNHVALGITPEPVMSGKLLHLRVKVLVAGMPADRSGIQVGDVITRIAGRQSKNVADFWDALERAAKSPTYQIDYLRNGTPMSATVERQFRAPVTEGINPVSTASAASPGVTPISVADELAKLSELRKQGILTEAEFETQKKKLLAQ